MKLEYYTMTHTQLEEHINAGVAQAVAVALENGDITKEIRDRLALYRVTPVTKNSYFPKFIMDWFKNDVNEKNQVTFRYVVSLILHKPEKKNDD